MSTYSTNQVRNLFIVKANVDGQPQVVGGADIVKFDNGELVGAFINYLGLYGQLRSDIIESDKILYAKAFKYVPEVQRVDTIEVTDAVPGQDYIIRIIFDNWGSGSAEDKYYKYAEYKAKSTDTTATIAAALAQNLIDNMSKEPSQLFDVTVAGAVITITSIDQPFVLGKKAGEQLVYNIQGANIQDGVDEYIPFTITKVAGYNPGTGTGREVANMEWFYQGERGDIYRGMGYPYNFEDKYMADPTATYNMVELGWFYAGENEAVQHSNKQITLAVPEAPGTFAVTNALIGKINTALGTNIPALV